jgi:hypothetical protein
LIRVLRSRFAGAGSGRLRLAVLEDASKRTLGPWVAENIEPGAIVHTDGWGGYAGLEDLGFDHQPISQRWRSEECRLILPRPRQPQGLVARHPPQRL